MLNYTGEKGISGVLPPGGIAVNGSAELRDLDSNDTLLRQIKERTGGRLLQPFDAASADLFSRDGLMITTSPQPIWDRLIPPLLILILIDVAVRRIAWDWQSMRRLAASAAHQVRLFTQTTRAVESTGTLDSLKRVRGEVAEARFKSAEATGAPAVKSAQDRAVTAGSPMSRPDPAAKFQAKGVEGDIASVVGGAVDKPVPSSARSQSTATIDAPATAHTGSLLEAKRRAQQQIKKKENDSL
jgi:Flp pilus assembly protein TadG